MTLKLKQIPTQSSAATPESLSKEEALFVLPHWILVTRASHRAEGWLSSLSDAGIRVELTLILTSVCFFFLKVMSIFPMRWQQAFVSQMVLCFSLMQLRGWVSSSARGSFQTLPVESLILLYHEGPEWVLLLVLKGFWRTVWEGNVFQPNQGVKPPASVARLGMTHVTCRLIP